MQRCFPKLTQTHVWVETDQNGGGFSCPMLPISALTELSDCSAAMAKVKSVDEIAKIRERMIELAKTVIPEKYHQALWRLDLPSLTKLLAYLMYGDDNDQPPEKN